MLDSFIFNGYQNNAEIIYHNFKDEYIKRIHKLRF